MSTGIEEGTVALKSAGRRALLNESAQVERAATHKLATPSLLSSPLPSTNMAASVSDADGG